MKKTALRILLTLFLGVSLAFTTKDADYFNVEKSDCESVTAKFKMGGKTFSGIQPTQRNPRGSKTASISGLSNVNNSEYKMHAEIDAMLKALKDGLSGGTGTLTVSGQAVCGYCKGDVKKMGLKLGLDKLVVIESDGDTFVFNGTKDLKPVSKGGKGWAEQQN